MKRMGIVAALALAVSFTGGLPAASAEPAVAATDVAAAVGIEIVVLHATNDGTGIDPKIGKMPELEKPPFSSYNSYKLLERGQTSVERGQATTRKLPTGRELRVTLKDVIPPKKRDEAARYVLSASIQKPAGTTFLPLLEVNAKAGESFFVAGQAYKGGVLVIGIKVLP